MTGFLSDDETIISVDEYNDLRHLRHEIVEEVGIDTLLSLVADAAADADNPRQRAYYQEKFDRLKALDALY